MNRRRKSKVLEQPDCVMCACKHLAIARSLEAEMHLGYPENYFYMMGEMALAEEHLIRKHPRQAERIREQRKRLESIETHKVCWKELILDIAAAGERRIQLLVVRLERKYSTVDDILAGWKKAQS